MSDDDKGKKKKGKGRWGMGFSAMAMAGQRLKSRLQRTRKMEAMSSEFTDLNQRVKETRRFIGTVQSHVEALRKAGDAYSSAMHAFSGLMVDLARNERHRAAIGPTFCGAFVQSQLTLEAVFDGQLNKTVDLATQPLDKLQELLATAKAEKAAAYEALHHKSVVTSGASKGGLKGQLAYDEAALDFSNRQRASINALDAVEQEVDLYVMDLLCSLAELQRDMVMPAAKAVGVTAEHANLTRDVVIQRRRAWAAERSTRCDQLQEARTIARAVGSASDLTSDAKTRQRMFDTMTAGLLEPVVLSPLPGEEVVVTIEQVVNAVTGQPGTLQVTNYRLRFFPFVKPPHVLPNSTDSLGRRLSCLDDSTADAVCGVTVPFMAVARAETVGGAQGLLALWCHDLRQARFGFGFSQTTVDRVMTTITPLLWHATAGTVFAFARRRGGRRRLSSGGGSSSDLTSAFTAASADALNLGQAVARSGWDLYSAPTELTRLTEGSVDGRYRVSKVNQQYRLCATYPSLVIVPTTVTDALLEAAAPFRSKSRFPALVWMHGSVMLSRSSQPRAGVFGSRSDKDERLLSLLCSPDAYVGGSYLGKDLLGKRLAICDARPYVNAVGNKGKGGGMESVSNYTDAHLEYLGIDNIHVVRNALATLHKLVRQASVDRKTNRDHVLHLADWSSSLSPQTAGAGAGGRARPKSMAVTSTASRALARNFRRQSSAEFARSSPQSFGSAPGGLTSAAASSNDTRARLQLSPSNTNGSGGRYSPPPDYARARTMSTPTSPRRFLASTSSERSLTKSRSGASRGSVGMSFDEEDDEDDEGGDVAVGAAGPVDSSGRRVCGGSDSGAASTAASSINDSEHAALDAVLEAGGGGVGGASDGDGGEGEAGADGGAGAGDDASLGAGDVSLTVVSDAAVIAPSANGSDSAVLASAGAGAGAGAGAAGTGAGVDAGDGADAGSGGEALSAERVFLVRDEDKDEHVQRIVAKVMEGSPEWLRLVSIVLSGGARVAKLLKCGVSVLVHCSDGWDRTAQLSALAQILLDPNARTTRGFCALIEKDWTSFGHQFARRCGTRVGTDRKNHGDRQRSPVFLQFLDCVWQLLQQFPSEFEFAESLLRLIADHVYSGRFGTFLFDCERERVNAGAPVKTVSLWTHVLQHPEVYRNAEYTRPKSAIVVPRFGLRASKRLAEALVPKTDEASMRLWPAYAERWLSTGQERPIALTLGTRT